MEDLPVPIAQALGLPIVPGVLNYRDLPFPPRVLTLDEADGWVRVTFPVQPAWVYWLSITLSFLFTAIQIGSIIAMLWMIERTWPSGGRGLTPELRSLKLGIVLRYGLIGTVGALEVAYLWWSYRRWGRVPRMILANGSQLVYSRLGWFRMREKIYPTDIISMIELRRVKGNLNRKKTLADLFVHRTSGRRLHFRLASRDSALPDRIAECLAATLGRPLVKR